MFITAPHTERRPSGLADALSVLQREIICEARRWIGVVESPPASNRGPEVDQFNRYYFGDPQWNKWSETDRRQPWCTTFAWFVIDRVVKRLGGQNRMPGAASRIGGDVVWGNSRRTLDASRSAGLRVDRIPAVGSVFFRTSSTPGDGSSGHMGIVISVQSSSFATVEGNQGTTHRVGQYTYPKTDIAEYGFQFIHVEETPITATKNTDACAPQNNGSSTPSLPTTGSQGSSQQSGSQGSSQQSGSQGSSQQSGSQGSSTTSKYLELLQKSREYADRQKEEPQKPLTSAELCRAVGGMDCGSVALLSGASWGQIRDMKTHLFARAQYADDITGGFRKDKYSSRRERNGIMTRPNGSDDQDDFSGWGMFRDGHGNLWYIVNADTPAWSVMYDLNLFGHGVTPYIFPLIRQFGDNYRERTSEVITGLRDQDYGFSAEGNPTRELWARLGLDKQGDLGFGVWKDEQLAMLGSREIRYRNGRELFDEIQKIGRLKRPIVMLIGGKPFNWASAGKLVTEIADYVMTVAGPFAKQFDIPFLTDAQQRIVSSVSQTVKDLIESKNVITISTILTSFSPIIKSIAPASVRPYVEKGVEAYAAIEGSNWRDLPFILNATLSDTELKHFMNSVRDRATGAVEQLLGKASFNDIRGKVENILNSRAVQGIGNRVAKATTKDAFYSEINRLQDDPDLRQILVSAGSKNLLPMLPGVTQVMELAIRKQGAFGDSRTYNAASATQEDQRVLQALTHTAMGIPGDEEALSPLAFAALSESAKERALTTPAGQRKTYVLPPSVPESKAECWAAKIRECHGVDVLIKGQDDDGVIRLDTQLSTRTTTINIPADFDRTDQQESTSEFIQRVTTTTGGGGAVERYVTGNTGTIVKEVITTDLVNHSNARDHSVRTSTGTSTTGRTGGDISRTTINNDGGLIPQIQTTTTRTDQSRTAEEIYRQQQLDEYNRSVEESRRRAEEQEQRRQIEEQNRRRAEEEREHQENLRRIQEEANRQRERMEEQARREREAEDARRLEEYRRQQQELERQRQALEQQKLIQESAKYVNGGSTSTQRTDQSRIITRLPDPVEQPRPDQPRPVDPQPVIPQPVDPRPVDPTPVQGRIITCPAGYIWDAVAQACVPNTVPQRPTPGPTPTPQGGPQGGGCGCNCGGSCGGNCGGCSGGCSGGCGCNSLNDGIEFY